MATWATVGVQVTEFAPSPLYGDMQVKWAAGGIFEPVEIMPSPADVRSGVTYGLYGRTTGTLNVTGGTSGSAASWS